MRRPRPMPWQRAPEPTLAERLATAMREHPEWGFRDLWRACGGGDVDDLGDLLVALVRARMGPDDGR